MPGIKARAIFNLVGWVLVCLLLAGRYACAERLPVKTYTTADGLAQNAVNRIVRDSRGFLWFCTEDGLSRYDGYTFTNYGVEQGLPSGRIIDVLETREGKYWIATFNGLCRFNPKGRPWPAGRGPLPAAQNNNQPTAADGRQTTDDPMFVPFPPNDYPTTGRGNVLLDDQTGAVWCGAGSGLCRLEQMDRELTLRFVEIGLPREVENDMRVRALVED